MLEEEIKHKAVRSVVALTLRTVFLQGVQVVSLFFLQIFLSPAQIGVFFVATAASQMLTLFTDVGLGAALVQKKEEISELDIKIVFTIQEILVLLAIALGIIISPIIQTRTGLTGDGMVLYFVLLFLLFISSLKVIPSILLERKLAFEKQVFPQVIETVIYYLIVVILAWKGWGVSSYSWGFLVSALVSLPIYYWLSPWKIGFALDLKRAKNLFSFGILYQGKSFLAIIKDNLFTVFLSSIVGTSGVGYWGTAQKWAYFPYRFVVDSVTKVTFPAYSRVQKDLEILRGGIERSLFMVSLILFPFYGIMVIIIRDLINLIPKYNKWEPIVISFYFLCAQAAIAALTNILVNVLDATGRVKTTLGLMILWTIGTWGVTLILISQFGFTGIAIAQFIVSLTIALVIYLVRKLVNFEFIRNVWPPLVATAIMMGAMVTLRNVLPVSFLSVLVTTVSGGIIYLTAVWFIAKQKIKEIILLILKAYQR
jgi:PST family polysaccharide transporter